MQMRTAFWVISIFLSAMIASPPAESMQLTGNTKNFCERQTQHHERVSGIPPHLLGAISLTESGRWNKKSGEKFAWPWTVTARGEGKFYPTKAAAIRAVRELQAEGVSNIDVGCMQINLYYHSEAFSSLHEAFDPFSNVAYAAKFLTRLYDDNKSWVRATRFYHSGDRERGLAYYGRVADHWRSLQEENRETSTARAEKQDLMRWGAQAVDPRLTQRINKLMKARKQLAQNTEPSAAEKFANFEALRQLQAAPVANILRQRPSSPQPGKTRGKTLADYRR